jgi:hypothetical protein
MISWLTWPVKLIARLLSLVRAHQIEESLADARYVEAEEWAHLKKITTEQAEEELEQGVKAGVLEKMFLYVGSDSPISFVVPEKLLNKKIRLSEIDDFSEPEDREILVSSKRAKPVYVAAATGAERYVNAA